MSRSVLRAAAAGLAAGALLAGCAQEPLPEPRPVEVTEPVPVVDDGQAVMVRERVLDVLASGDEALDAAPLESRVTGPALEVRTARYTLRRQLEDRPELPDLGGELLLTAAPEADGWPRWFLTASRPAPDAAPQLQVLTQESPREMYRLTAWVTMLPGTTLPELPSGEPVQALDPAEQSGLVAAPAQVVARYADALALGDDSEHAEFFADDVLRAQVVAEQEAEREAVSEFFDYDVTHTPREGQVWALRTSDGGAVVLGAIESRRAFAVTAEGARLPLPEDLAVLAGTEEATEAATVTSLQMVAFAVPPEGSSEPVTVLGGERAVLAATAT
ncbi:hypothetical protein ACFP6A_07485 [Quadrisphaera sp. GCM10027208]|uniref:hypothetical protein n=1 Tax=Quadrisphaera sp. GCM10027208 TaxID=3273423 RepID=UPI00361356E8